MDNQEVELVEKQLTPIFPCEWCFKFGDNEPQVFAATNEKIDDQEPAIRLMLANTEETTVTFQDGDNAFTLFCRPLTEAGQVLINQNNQLQDDSSNGLQSNA
jgi:hypothetical protein